jgi:hypothetical protein
VGRAGGPGPPTSSPASVVGGAVDMDAATGEEGSV